MAHGMDVERMIGAELIGISDKLEVLYQNFQENHFHQIDKVTKAVAYVAKSWSGSILGYQANVYYADFQVPPPGNHFSAEWGIEEHWPIQGTTGDWREYNSDTVAREIFRTANSTVSDATRSESASISTIVTAAKADILSILAVSLRGAPDKFLEVLQTKAGACKIADNADFERAMRPQGQVMTRDSLAMSQGFRTAPHLAVLAEMLAIKQPSECAKKLAEIARQAGSHLIRLERQTKRSSLVGTNIFIGHGRSPVWRVLKDFIKDRLGLPFDEFNRVPVAGITNIARLTEVLDSSTIAFLVLTAEDELADGKQQARMNVIHEVGLFQGRLGFTRAIVLLEQGCEEFSNIQGLGQIRFPKDNIAAAFEEIRLVLEREGIIVS